MLEECGPDRGGPYRRPGSGAHHTQTAAGPADGPGSGRPFCLVGSEIKGPTIPREPPPAARAILRSSRSSATSFSYFDKLLSLVKEPRPERGGSGPRPGYQFQEGQGPVGWP